MVPDPGSFYFVGGIDTEIGKTQATGLLGRFLLQRGERVITQKLVQTGMEAGIAEDILEHRRLMGVEPLDIDRNGLTCPQVFRIPASPHLAAEEEGREVDLEQIDAATRALRSEFDWLLLEGVGGMHVPLRRDMLAVDYLQILRVPLILVTSGRLGSVSHTLAILEIIQRREIPLAGLVFNHFHPTLDVIRRDSLSLFRDELARLGRPGALVEMPVIDGDAVPEVDFSPLFATESGPVF